MSLPRLLPESPIAFVLALAVSFAMTLVAWLLQAWLDPANIVMLFLLVVLLVARYAGRWPAVLVAFLSVALFDFFFVPPRFSFAVNDGQYVVTFIVMLATALITGTLTAGLRREADEAAGREARARALYEMGRELAGAMTLEQVLDIGRHFLRTAVGAEVRFLLLQSDESLRVVEIGSALKVEEHLAHMALSTLAPVECEPMAASGYAVLYVPLRAPTRPRGVLAVAPVGGDYDTFHKQRALVETAASLLAIAFERLHYVDAAQLAEVSAATERLRASLLSAISHDLRTPLTALHGMAETLVMTQGDQQRDLAAAVRDQAVRLSRMVSNLLDMARLQLGRVNLKKEWQPLEEVVGSSLKLLEYALADREIRLDLPKHLPLLEFDAVLIERVLCNLLENAAKYSPTGSPIQIAASIGNGLAKIQVSNAGAGFPAGREEAVFAVFERGEPEQSQAGVGLGLAICRSIVEVHGGSIRAINPPESGACVEFTLPVGTPPMVPEESELLEEMRS